jgi:transcriptional regulator with XRE-family HTH domain
MYDKIVSYNKRNERRLMANYLDIEKLASLVRTKRRERGLREVSREIGTVSPSTISRVENGKVPDIDTFLILCDWLDVPPAALLGNDSQKGTLREIESTPDRIAFLLQSDSNLDPSIANALALLIKAAYRDFLKL